MINSKIEVLFFLSTLMLTICSFHHPSDCMKDLIPIDFYCASYKLLALGCETNWKM